MNIPQELSYTDSHEWILKLDGDRVRIGLTDFAQHELGDLVFVNLPQEGDGAELGVALCDVESVKAVSDVFSPLSGTVTAVNEELLDAPERINQAPYEAWLVELGDVTEWGELMDAAAYAAFCAKEAD